MPDQRKVAQDFDRFRVSYTEQINEAVSFTGFEAAFFIQVKSEYLMWLAAKHFGDVSRIAALDLGCGIGAYHAGLAGKFKSLSGIDVSAESVEHAKKQNPVVDYRSYEGGALPYAGDTFDLVFAICVLHHVPPDSWREFASEMYRVVKPGGLAVVFEHNPINPVTQYIVRTCPIDEDAVLLWSWQTSRLLRNAGFSAAKARTILSVPPVNRALSLVDRALGHLPFGAQYYVAAAKQDVQP